MLILVLFFLGYMACPTILILIQMWLQQHGKTIDSYTVMLVPYILTIILFSLLLRVSGSGLGKELAPAGGFFRWRMFSYSFVIMIAFQLVMLVLPLQTKTVNGADNGLLIRSAAIALASIPFQTLFEEILYRLLPLHLVGNGRIVRGSKSIAAIIVSSAIFTLMHMNNPEITEYGYVLVFYYFLSGVVLGAFMTATGGIEMSWAYHLGINLYGAIVASAEGGVLQNRTFFILESNHAVAQSFIFLILSSLVMMYLICKWKKNNLFSL